MKLISFAEDGSERCGLLRGDRVAMLGDGQRLRPLRMLDLIEATPRERAELIDQAGPERPLSAFSLLPPLPEPGAIFCVGLNYAAHEKEAPVDGSDYPTIFLRLGRNQIADGAPMITPEASQTLDWEGELVAVIGKGGRHIVPDRAFDHVFGYSIYNEASVREYQHHSSQFGMGKNFEGTGAFGPCIITAEAFGDPYAQSITTTLDGEVVQTAPISSMIHKIEDVIAYVSSATPLRPGDLILTGTPAGVGAARRPPRFLKDGETISVEISGLGRLTNMVQREAPPAAIAI